MVSTEMFVYIGMMLVGFGFLLLSFFGGSDSDVGHDVGGHDVAGGDVAGMDSPGLSPLSMPMIASFLATAGGTGTLFAASGTDSTLTAAFAVMTGVVVFLGSFIFVAKFLAAAQSSSTVHEKEYEGKIGVVTETIADDGVGAVAVTVHSTRYVVSARSKAGRIPIGTEVRINRVVEGMAQVEELRMA